MTVLMGSAPCALCSVRTLWTRSASIDLCAGILDRLRPSWLLRRNRGGKLFGAVRREWLHAELQQLLLELLRLLNSLQLRRKARDDLSRHAGRRDDPLPCLPVEPGDRSGDRRHVRQQRGG